MRCLYCDNDATGSLTINFDRNYDTSIELKKKYEFLLVASCCDACAKSFKDEEEFKSNHISR